jgi:hypothetical protein
LPVLCNGWRGEPEISLCSVDRRESTGSGWDEELSAVHDFLLRNFRRIGHAVLSTVKQQTPLLCDSFQVIRFAGLLKEGFLWAVEPQDDEVAFAKAAVFANKNLLRFIEASRFRPCCSSQEAHWPPFQNLARYLDVRLTWIKALASGPQLGF